MDPAEAALAEAALVGGRGEIGCGSCNFLWVDGLSFENYVFLKSGLKIENHFTSFEHSYYNFQIALRFLNYFLKLNKFFLGQNFGN